jgi:molybdopterin-guanine dinucleotide biosynthesis protein A
MSSPSSSRPPRIDVSALILAGGKATRFGGIAKHELLVDGQTIVARQTAVLAPRVAEIIISSSADIAGYRTVRDRIAGAGPLAGIAAGLAACTTDWLLVVAGDMPYLTGDLIDRMLALRAGDAVGVMHERLPEPLLCLLRRGVAPVIERRLAAGHLKASGLLTDEGLSVHWLTDADPAALRNVNSPADL